MPAADPAAEAGGDGGRTARARLARAQAELLAALVGGAEPPPGFDAERVRVQAAALAAKRREVVAKVAPELAHRMGPRFAGLFAEYARTHPRPAAGGRADAAAFAATLGARGLLPPGSGSRPGRGLLARFRRS